MMNVIEQARTAKFFDKPAESWNSSIDAQIGMCQYGNYTIVLFNEFMF